MNPAAAKARRHRREWSSPERDLVCATPLLPDLAHLLHREVVVGRVHLPVVRGVVRGDHHLAVGREHPPELEQHRLPMLHVVHHERRDHDVELVVGGEGQRRRQVREVKRGAIANACTGEVEHRRTDVDRGDGRTLIDEPLSERPSTAAHFEDPLAGDGTEQRNRGRALVTRIERVVVVVGRVVGGHRVAPARTELTVGRWSTFTRSSTTSATPCNQVQGRTNWLDETRSSPDRLRTPHSGRGAPRQIPQRIRGDEHLDCAHYNNCPLGVRR